jgi:hypothetical protein
LAQKSALRNPKSLASGVINLQKGELFLPPIYFYFKKKIKIKNGIRKKSRAKVQIPSFGGGWGRSNQKSEIMFYEALNPICLWIVVRESQDSSFWL